MSLAALLPMISGLASTMNVVWYISIGRPAGSFPTVMCDVEAVTLSQAGAVFWDVEQSTIGHPPQADQSVAGKADQSWQG